MSSSPQPQITVSPSLRTVVDERINISITNLTPGQNIRLISQTEDDKKRTYESTAMYKANNQGEVFLNTHTSLAGSYTGIQPMAFIWSMKPKINAERDNLFRKFDVAVPMTIDIHVYNEEDKVMASTTLTRIYMAAGVTRLPLEDYGFYGTLFLPPGDGPFPGVIDLWGRTGRIREDRAALFASNGIASLTLAYTNYRDLPGRNHGILQLSYFEKAIDWLIAHPKVIPNGVGVLGLSLGGALSLAISSQIPHKVKAVVSIVGYPFLLGYSLQCKDKMIPGYPKDNMPGKFFFADNASILRSMNLSNSPSVIPVENITCPVLLVYGLEDKFNPEVVWMTNEIVNLMGKNGKGSLVRKCGFQGAGHMILPCYSPTCTRSYIRELDKVFLLGGELQQAAHANAMECLWKESLLFLKKYIV